jgi:hypothetical protein
VTADPRTDVSEARAIRALWTGVLLAPITVLLDLELAYALVPTACSSRNVLPVHLVHMASLLVALFGGLVAWGCWKAMGSTWPGEENGSLGWSRFMAGIGMLLSPFSALVIIAMWIPSFILNPCQ